MTKKLRVASMQACSRIAFSLFLLLFSGLEPATAQDQQESQQLQGVIVTGSHIRRTDIETPSPIQVISADDIKKLGAASTADLLQLITASAGSTVLGQADGFAAGSVSANLHNVGPSDTLVLLNSRRMAPYGQPNQTLQGSSEAAVNLNSIPVSAIDRVEVLKAGASAIYGSDALAGVINIITKKSAKGMEINAYYGETTHGDGATTNVSLTTGFKSGDVSGLIFANYFNSSEIVSANRAMPASQSESSGSSFSPTVFITDNNGNQQQFNLCSAAIQAQFNGACRTDLAPFNDLAPPQNGVSFYTNINDNLFSFERASGTAYFESLINYSRVNNLGPDPTPVNADDNSNALAAPTNPFTEQVIEAYNNSAAGKVDPAPLNQSLNPRHLALDFGNRTIESVDLTQRYILGLRGDLFDSWDYDLGLMYSSDTLNWYGNNFISDDAAAAALSSGIVVNNAAGQQVTEFLNPFGPTFGNNTPEVINALKVNYDTLGDSKLESADFTVNGPIYKLMGHDISLAVGTERRYEYYYDTPDFIQRPRADGTGGLLAGDSGTPISGSRALTSVYGELDIPISHYAEIQFAERHEQYSDFGTANKPKLAVKVTPYKWLVLRAGLDSGFRAPSLGDLFTSQFLAFEQLNDPTRCAAETKAGVLKTLDDCPNSNILGDTQITSGGNPKLQPETSKSVYYGVVFEPIEGDSIGIDTFDIRVTNVIGPIPPQILIDNGVGITRGPPQFVGDPGPITNVVGGSINGTIFTTRGFDIDGQFMVPTRVLPESSGKLKFRTAWTYVSQFIYGVPGVQANGNTAGTDNFNTLPRWKGNYELDYTYHQIGLTLRADVVSGWDEQFGPVRINTHQTFDLQGTYEPSFVKRVKVTFGILNIFDLEPEHDPGDEAVPGTTYGYDPTVYSDVGRFIYANVSYRTK